MTTNTSGTNAVIVGPVVEYGSTEPSATEPVIIEPDVVESTTDSTSMDFIYDVFDIFDVPELPSIDSFRTIYDVEAAIEECEDLLERYDRILESMPLDHKQRHEVHHCQSELLVAIDRYSEILDAHWKSREARRPIMTYVWQNLKTRGWSDELVAGVIGNMVAECGGMGYQDLDWDVYGYDSSGNAYYGICQWALMYVPELRGTASLDKQLDYLDKSLKKEMNIVYSRSYREKFGLLDMRYDEFMAMDDAYDAAIAFAVCYERCAARYVECRGPLAEKAYEYFIVLDSWPWVGD